MHTILITGASGFIAKSLINYCSSLGHIIHTLSRKPIVDKRIKSFLWNIDKNEIDLNAFNNIDTIIHLAGENIGEGYWTVARKKAIVDSRIKSTELLLNTLKENQWTVKTYIGASATGFYGNRGNEMLTETSKPGSNFLATTCIEWENAHQLLSPFCSNHYILRFPVVLDANEGALPKMLMTYPMAINYFGNGQQFMPWICISDLGKLISYFIEKMPLSGVYNAHHPQTINNKDFIFTLDKYKKSLSPILPIPSFVLKIVMGESASLVLDSQNSSSQKILDTGFKFEYASLDKAFEKLFMKK